MFKNLWGKKTFFDFFFKSTSFLQLSSARPEWYSGATQRPFSSYLKITCESLYFSSSNFIFLLVWRAGANGPLQHWHVVAASLSSTLRNTRRCFGLRRLVLSLGLVFSLRNRRLGSETKQMQFPILGAIGKKIKYPAFAARSLSAGGDLFVTSNPGGSTGGSFFFPSIRSLTSSRRTS